MAFFFSPPPLPEHRGLRFIWTTLLLSWLASFGPLCTDMYLPTLPDIARELQISATLTQGSITACLLGLSLGQLIVGPVSDGRGRHGMLVLSLLLFTAASFLCARASSGPELLVLRFLQGFGGAGGTVLGRALCCDVYSGSKLTQYMALLMACHSIAPIAGPLCGGFIAGFSGWQGVFFVLGMVGVVLVLGSAFTLPETLPPERRIRGGILSSFTNMGALFREKTFLCYAGVQGFSMGGFFAYISASPFVFQNIYGLSMETFSFIFGANAIGMLCFSLLTAKLSARFGDWRLLMAGDSLRVMACLSVLAVSLTLPASPVPLMAALFSMLVMQSITMTTSFSLAISSQSVGAGAAAGILGVAVFLFGSLTSPLTGLAGPGAAWPMGVVIALTGSCSLLCSFFGNRGYRRVRGIS